VDNRAMERPFGVENCVSTTTVADKLTGKVVGKPYWGKPDVRFDEGAGGSVLDVGAYPGA